MRDDYSVIQDVELQIRRISIVYENHELDLQDIQLFRDILGLQYSLLHDLLPQDPLSWRKWRSFLGMGVLDVTRYGATLKFADAYMKNLTRSKADECGLWNFQTFKQSVKDAGLYWGLLSPVEPLFRMFMDNGDAGAFARINTWLNFPMRTNLRSLDLSSEMELEYVTFEESMEEWLYPSDIISEMNKIMREWFADFTLKEFVPCNGPGSVAEIGKVKPTLVGKYLHMKTDCRIDYFYRHELKYEMSDDFPFTVKPGLSRVSALICVPKSLTKNRTISKEPAMLQYLQQGVRRCITDHMEKQVTLRKIISLDDQSLSRDLAREGSILGEFGTLDLSNASDSVSYSLVKSLFRGTRLLPALVCTRSEFTVLPSGRKLPLRKFAPMGSAVCFPIECLIFACVCEYVHRLCGHRGQYRIYGDDIVASECLCSKIIETLGRLHFTVNEGKTFFEGGIIPFREACGGEYLSGFPVAPFRVSRKWRSCQLLGKTLTMLSADIIASNISFANKAFECGMMHTRRGILDLMRKRYPYFNGCVFGQTDDRLLTWPDGCTNWKLRSRLRLNAHSGVSYQRTEVKGCVMTTQEDVRRCRKAYQYHFSNMDDSFIQEVEDRVRYQLYWLRLRRSTVWPQDYFLEIAPESPVVRPTASVMKWKWVYD